MELKEFIKETLISVVKGVESANMVENRFYIVGEHSLTMADRVGTYIDFDVAVVASESKEDNKQGGIGIRIASAFLSGSKGTKQNQSNESINRLKFKIFVSAKK